MKNILVPTDFSPNARNALRYAVQLAKLFDSRLHLLHTFTVSSRSDMFVSMENIMRKDAEREMDTLSREIPSEVRWESRIMKGDTIRSIAASAEQVNADLIVMGTQGASGLEKVFIGSVTGGVMRQTNVPLLAIPEGYSYRTVKKIVLALASLQLSNPEEVIAPLKTLASKFKANVQIYHHDQAQEEIPDEVVSAVDWLHGIPVSVTFDQDDDQINENISEFVSASDADMLCMVRRTHNSIGFFERLFKESVTLAQVFHCEVPLLVLHCDR